MKSYFFHVIAELIPLQFQVALVMPSMYRNAFMKISDAKDVHDKECGSANCMSHSVLDGAIFRRMPMEFMEAYAEADFKDGEIMAAEARVWRNFRSLQS